MNRFEKARYKYLPKEIKYLLVAETPPKSVSNRFFYFEEVDRQDSLFLETMKFLYPQITDNLDTKSIRIKKKEFLQKFKKDCFYLIDSLDTPFEEEYKSSQKVRLLREGQEELFYKIKDLLQKRTQVVLISFPVYKANFEYLKNKGIPVINQEPIDFPGSGGQKKYQEKMRRIINVSSI